MELICGIDEAGRGPVLGPLVMAGVAVSEEKIAGLKDIGVKDSKLLSAPMRLALFKKIIALADCYEIAIIAPTEIDAYILSLNDSKNLNWLEAEYAARIIDILRPAKAIIDCPSPNIVRYCDFIKQKIVCKNVTVICEHKADMNYAVVSAASILAKVTRDNTIEELKKEVGVDFGSGYLTDPKTIAFLDAHWDKYNFFRRSWSSWQNRRNAKTQKRLGEW